MSHGLDRHVADAASQQHVHAELPSLQLIKTSRLVESVHALIQLSRKIDSLQVHCRIASALNMLLSFKSAPLISGALAGSVRDFLHGLLEVDQADTQRAAAIYALRGVGDLDSIERINRLPGLGDPWRDAPRSAVGAIRRRLARGDA